MAEKTRTGDRSGTSPCGQHIGSDGQLSKPKNVLDAVADRFPPNDGLQDAAHGVQHFLYAKATSYLGRLKVMVAGQCTAHHCRTCRR